MAVYLMDPDETEKGFADCVFHTGDLAVMHSDGQIEIRDRAKDIIISGGENFSSLEVETVLHQHPSILLAAVVGAPHPKWGEVAWAFIESADGNPLDEVELDTFCRARLAGFKRPKKFVFCELPKTAAGKIQKFVLRNKSKEMASNEPDCSSAIRGLAWQENTWRKWFVRISGKRGPVQSNLVCRLRKPPHGSSKEA